MHWMVRRAVLAAVVVLALTETAEARSRVDVEAAQAILALAKEGIR